jgi:hypothetical protein
LHDADYAALKLASAKAFRTIKERANTMTRFVISAAALIALTMSASAEIICTDHGGCRETGRRIILGNGGGVNNSQTLVSHRGNKPQKVRINRTIYSNE